MEKIIYFMVIAIISIAVTGCSSDSPENISEPEPQPIQKEEEKPAISYAKSIELSAEGLKGVELQNEFAVDVFKDVFKKSKNENSLLSPLSLTTCVSMFANGASEEAADEIIGKLMGNGVSMEKFNETNSYLMSELISVDNSTSFVMSNSVWLNKDLQFNPGFESTVKDFYNAGTSALDLYSSHSMDVINNWTSESTNGLITQLFKTAPSSPFVIANAIYFKGGWVVEFDKNNTQKKNFTNLDGSISLVDMMKIDGKSFLFYTDNDFSAVSLPYGNMAFSLYALLPNENGNIETFIQGLTAETLSRLSNRMSYCDLDIEMPKFEISQDIDNLSDYLHDNGLENSFGMNVLIPSLAMTSLSGEISCIQKSKFIVNESGAEGASVTSLGINYLDDGGVVIPTKQSLVLDRPFLFIVQEKSTKAILFIGTVVKL